MCCSTILNSTILKTRGKLCDKDHHGPISLEQKMHILHLKTQVSDSTHGTQEDRLKNALPKSDVSVCQPRHDRMEQGPTEPHAGRSTFLLSSGGAGGGYY